MPSPPTHRTDLTLLLFAFALFLLASPLVDWWSGEGSPWYTPYLLWLLIIALARRLQRQPERP